MTEVPGHLAVSALLPTYAIVQVKTTGKLMIILPLQDRGWWFTRIKLCNWVQDRINSDLKKN